MIKLEVGRYAVVVWRNECRRRRPVSLQPGCGVFLIRRKYCSGDLRDIANTELGVGIPGARSQAIAASSQYGDSGKGDNPCMRPTTKGTHALISCHLTMKLSGRTEALNWSRGRTCLLAPAAILLSFTDRSSDC